MADLEMTNTQEAFCKLAIKNKAGGPAEVDGIPAWHSSDETIAIVVLNPKDATGKNAIIRAAGLAGECDILVNADADLGDGVKPLIGRQHCIVTESPNAAVLELTASAPVEQGSEPPAPDQDLPGLPEGSLPPHGATLPDGPSAQPRRR